MQNKTLGLSLTLFLFIILSSYSVNACVGRILYIGAIDHPEEKLMAEMLVLLINERTGTSVKIRYFDDKKQIYTAMKSNLEKGRVDIIIENTVSAAAFLQFPRQDDLNKEYATIKKHYDQDLSIIWLNPFGFTNNHANSSQSMSAPLVRRDVLTNFPLLPRVLNKLSGAIDNEVYLDMLDKIGSGEKQKNVARNFLQKKKLI